MSDVSDERDSEGPAPGRTSPRIEGLNSLRGDTAPAPPSAASPLRCAT